MNARTLLASALLLFACDKSQSSAPSDPTASAPTPGADDGSETPGEPPSTGAECKPTGCSGIVCDDEEVMTTCEYRPEYACYKDATCTRQADGECGWTQTPELQACLDDPPSE